MRAQIDRIADIRGKARHRPQHVKAELRARLRIGGDPARVIIHDACDQPGRLPFFDFFNGIGQNQKSLSMVKDDPSRANTVGPNRIHLVRRPRRLRREGVLTKQVSGWAVGIPISGN